MNIPKVLKYTIGGLVLVILIGFVLLEIACRETMYKRSAFSFDRETAIKEGFYIDTYIPVQSAFILPKNRDTLNFDSAWTEHSWTTERKLGLCLFEHKVKGVGYNFCAPFSTTSSDINSFPFDLTQLRQADDPYFDPGSYFGGRFNFGLTGVVDTIRLVISQKQKDIITSSFIDTLLFVKKKKITIRNF